MDNKQKIMIVGVGAVGVIGLLWLASRGNSAAPVAASPASLQFASPSSPPIYQLGTTGQPPPASTALQAAAPQSSLVFNVLGGGSPIYGNPLDTAFRDTGGDTGNGLSNAVGYGDGCGCGCNAPGATTDASGTFQSLATLMAPFMSKLAGILPTGTVAPGIVSPGANDNMAAAIDVWQRQTQEVKQASLDVFPPGFGPSYSAFG